ncbi:hypothetical protein CPB97_009035 [Podila verticillata]|nr:hypothetical protein CPB97_009035 [Podila verticillata]
MAIRTCRFCRRKYTNVRSHIYGSHDGEKGRLTPFRCPEDGCKTATQSRYHFKKHLLKHGYSASAAASIIDPPVHESGPPSPAPSHSDEASQGSSTTGGAHACLDCEETFSTAADLDVHLQEHASTMSLDHDGDQGSDCESASAQNTSMEDMGHETKVGTQVKNEGMEETHDLKAKLDQLQEDLDRASGSPYITEFVLRFLEPVMVEGSSGEEVAVYAPKQPQDVSGVPPVHAQP